MTQPRRDNNPWQDRIVLPLDIVSKSATFTNPFHKCEFPFVVESVQYVNYTGLAADPANFFDIELKDAAVSMAKWSTLTGAQGALTANTFVEVPLNATAANVNAVSGDTLSLVLTLHGTQTLPAGRLVVHGRYL